jgi:hypothetical protein
MTTALELESLTTSQRIDRMEQQLHDLIATLRRSGALPQPSSGATASSKGNSIRSANDAPAPASVKRLWLARRNAVASAIRRHAFDLSPAERSKLHGEKLTKHNALRFRHLLYTLRMVKPFRDEENRVLPFPQVTPLVLSALQGVPGAHYVTGAEARARGLGTTSACIIVTPEFDKQTKIPTTPTTPTEP